MFNKQGALEMTYTQEQINVIVQQAQIAAHQAALDALAKYGDRDACGFAWTDIYGVKGNTKLGKMLKAAGLRKDWTGKAFQIWNPAGVGVQSVGILEAGADAAAKVFRDHGFTAYAGSRLD
jgi:hypothetical protein